MSPALRSFAHRFRAGGAGSLDRVEEQVVWLLGSPRSGTTWLLGLLARLTDGTRIDEPLIGAHLAVSLSAVSGFATDGEGESLLLDTGQARPSYFFSEAASHVWLPDLRALILRRFDVDRQRDGRPASMVLVKEPNGSLATPLLLRALPTSRALFLVRDGRDVVDSELDAASGGWFSSRYGMEVPAARRREYLERRARSWVATMAAIEAGLAGHAPERQLRLTYEDLVADTAPHVSAILRWLGRTVADDAVTDAVERLSFANVDPAKRGPGQFARAASPGLWREHFDEAEQRILTDIMGPTLEALGYPAS